MTPYSCKQYTYSPREGRRVRLEGKQFTKLGREVPLQEKFFRRRHFATTISFQAVSADIIPYSNAAIFSHKKKEQRQKQQSVVLLS
jgi:hypothetical protein